MKSAKAGNETISAPVLLLVEGRDEEYLVRKMCEHWFPAQTASIDVTRGCRHADQTFDILSFSFHRHHRQFRCYSFLVNNKMQKIKKKARVIFVSCGWFQLSQM